MRQELIEEVSAEFARQRERNVQEHDARVEKATAADPRIGALLKERQERFRLAAQEAFRRPEQAMERSARLKEEIAAINAQIRERAACGGVSRGLPATRLPLPQMQGYRFRGRSRARAVRVLFAAAPAAQRGARRCRAQSEGDVRSCFVRMSLRTRRCANGRARRSAAIWSLCADAANRTWTPIRTIRGAICC